jgi:hypothetical protein
MIVLALGSGAAAADGDYRAEVDRWRQKREAELKADDGWLTLAGLAWLRLGETRIGSDPACDVVVLPMLRPLWAY